MFEWKMPFTCIASGASNLHYRKLRWVICLQYFYCATTYSLYCLNKTVKRAFSPGVKKAFFECQVLNGSAVRNLSERRALNTPKSFDSKSIYNALQPRGWMFLIHRHFNNADILPLFTFLKRGGLSSWFGRLQTTGTIKTRIKGNVVKLWNPPSWLGEGKIP